MRNHLARLGASVLDLVYPPQCFGCDAEGSFLCSTCETSLPRLKPPYCRKCAQPVPSGALCRQCTAAPPALEGIRAVFLMEGSIREAVHAVKYSNLRAAAPSLGRLMARWLVSTPLPGEVLLSVPLHKRRLRERGYNQSALLAKEVSKVTGLPLRENLLVRTRDTPPQISLSLQERIRNVEGSFELPGDGKGLKIILVDDVVTTGSTMSACGKALRAGGAGSVWGLALAREGCQS